MAISPVIHRLLPKRLETKGTEKKEGVTLIGNAPRPLSSRRMHACIAGAKEMLTYLIMDSNTNIAKLSWTIRREKEMAENYTYT